MLESAQAHKNCLSKECQCSTCSTKGRDRLSKVKKMKSFNASAGNNSKHECKKNIKENCSIFLLLKFKCFALLESLRIRVFEENNEIFF